MEGRGGQGQGRGGQGWEGERQSKVPCKAGTVWMEPGASAPVWHWGVHECHPSSSSSHGEWGPRGGRGIPEEGPLLGTSPEGNSRNDLSLVHVKGKGCPGLSPKSAEHPFLCILNFRSIKYFAAQE